MYMGDLKNQVKKLIDENKKIEKHTEEVAKAKGFTKKNLGEIKGKFA